MSALPQSDRAPRAVPGLRLAPSAYADAGEEVSPELALVDPALRVRLLGELCEPGAFRPNAPVRKRTITRPVGHAHPPGGYQAPLPLALLDSVRGRTRGLPAVIILALIAGAAGLSVGLEVRTSSSSQPGAIPATPSAVSLRTGMRRSPQRTGIAQSSRPTIRQQAPPRIFAWAPSPGAVGYEIQFFRGTERVLSRRVAGPRLALPHRWRYAGKAQALKAGTYRWYVWPLRGSTPIRSREPVVQASFRVQRRA